MINNVWATQKHSKLLFCILCNGWECFLNYAFLREIYFCKQYSEFYVMSRREAKSNAKGIRGKFNL